MDRDKYIQIRVSQDEKDKIEENAGEKSISEYLRELGLRIDVNDKSTNHVNTQSKSKSSTDKSNVNTDNTCPYKNTECEEYRSNSGWCSKQGKPADRVKSCNGPY